MLHFDTAFHVHECEMQKMTGSDIRDLLLRHLLMKHHLANWMSYYESNIIALPLCIIPCLYLFYLQSNAFCSGYVFGTPCNYLIHMLLTQAIKGRRKTALYILVKIQNTHV